MHQFPTLHRDAEWQPVPLQTKIFALISSKKIAKEVMQLDQNLLGRLIRMVTGHHSLQKHHHRIDWEEYFACLLCSTDQESLLRLLKVCYQLADVCQKIFGNATWLPDEGWCLEKLFEFSYHKLVKPVFVRWWTVAHKNSDCAPITDPYSDKEIVVDGPDSMSGSGTADDRGQGVLN